MDGQPHILVLDPDAAIRALLLAVVRRIGLPATACGTAEEAAAECMRCAQYAAVIVSADMPRYDALLHELRVAPPSKRPKIILTTTVHTTPSATGADTVLWKPFYLTDLQAAITSCCGL